MHRYNHHSNYSDKFCSYGGGGDIPSSTIWLHRSSLITVNGTSSLVKHPKILFSGRGHLYANEKVTFDTGVLFGCA